jgi:AraC-like DNA-binding protein
MAVRLKLIRSGRYLSKITMWVAIALFIAILFFAAILYFSVERTVLENTNESNRQVLYQMEYNINNMDEMIKNITLSTFFNENAMALMHESFDTDDLYKAITGMDNLRKSLLNINSYIHSTYIYNSMSKTFFSSYKSIIYQDNMLEKAVRSYQKIPVLKPIVREVEGAESASGKVYEKVITYYIYQQDWRNGAVVMNIKAKWFLDNINSINRTNPKKGDKVFLLSDRRDYIDDNRFDSGLKSDLKARFLPEMEQRIKQGENSGFVTAKISGSKYYVTYLYIAKADWIILKVQSYNEVFKHVNQLKISILLITLLFLALTAVFSRTISKRIYKPIGGLVNKVLAGKNPQQESGYSDEISMLEAYYLNTDARLRQAVEEKNSNRDILKSYYLRNLLVDSYNASDEVVANLKKNGLTSLEFGCDMILCVIRLDNYKSLLEVHGSRDIELFKFAIANILSELVSTNFKNDYINMKNDQIAMIVNITDSKSDPVKKLVDTIRQAQVHVLTYYSITFSSSISKINSDIRKISSEYGYALSNLSYRYVLGRMCVITPALAARNIENMQMDMDFSSEKKLIEELKAGNAKETEEILSSILVEISRLCYNNILLTSHHLVNTVKKTLEEINNRKLQPLPLDLSSLESIFPEMETIDDLYIALMGIIRKTTGEMRTDNKERHGILAETIMSIVDANYSDTGLCLQQIASLLKMSPIYVGRIFKEAAEKSVADYINEVRLCKAVEWLERSSLSISEVIGRVGIESESHFYKLFKKKFGTTPKEYILKKAIRGV